MSVLSLPDEILLMVFEGLPNKDLLRARRVCRRWMGIASCKEAWQHRDVSSLDRCAVEALRVAPCIRRLSLPHHKKHWSRTLAAATDCAILELAMCGDDFSTVRICKAVELIQRQVELGRLRVLSLCLFLTSRSTIREIVSIVQNSQVEVFELFRVGRRPQLEWKEMPVGGGAALRELSYLNPDPLWLGLLAAHRDTLERVSLSMISDYIPYERFKSYTQLRLLTGDSFHHSPDAQVMAALSKCPRLRTLDVPLDLDLTGLRCRGLRHLRLTVMPYLRSAATEATVVRAGRFLARSIRLEELSVHEQPRPLYGGKYQYQEATDVSGPAVLRLLEAMASTGLSGLRVLRWESDICRKDMEDEPVNIVELALMLPRLPRLHTLQLRRRVHPEFLDVITPETAPSLRVLQVSHLYPDRGQPCLASAAEGLIHRMPPQFRFVTNPCQKWNCNCGLKQRPSSPWSTAVPNPLRDVDVASAVAVAFAEPWVPGVPQ